MTNENTLQKLFEKQIETNPNKIALVFEGKKFTFDELNQKTNSLAHYLIHTYQIKPNTLVTLCLDRSEHMIIAILAVLKAGGAYVPIDPKYPLERIEYLIQDTQAQLILTDTLNQKKLHSITIQKSEANQHFSIKSVIPVDAVTFQEQLKSCSVKNPITQTKTCDLAYIIYTSGTTGRPKGVMIEHRSVINNAVFAVSKIYDFSQGDKTTAFASYAFDSSIPEFFSPLLRGGELHLLSEQVRMDVTAISNYIIQHEINYLYLPPVLLATMPRKAHKSLKAIIYAGEPCDVKTVQYWSKQICLYNCYGPTETAVNATYRKVNDFNTKLIGKPIDNTQCYVLDAELNPVKIGEIGELFIGGIGVARGYLNRDELNKTRFIPNPFQSKSEKILGINDRLYNTGDLVRCFSDGNIEYVGRKDSQVKIRGFRIELGEIENAILEYSDKNNEQPITQSIVVTRERTIQSESTKIKYLVGYYLSKSQLDEEKIFSYLEKKMPDYMVPNYLVHLKEIPLTVNGKINKNALPEPELCRSIDSNVCKNPLEKDICKIFAEILGLNENQMGNKSDFFRLGGNSILATKLTAKINNFFQSHLTVSDIFLTKNIESLAIQISQKKSQWQGLVCFNYSAQSKNLFMIHPGMGGCEVYAPLVEKLSPSFNCYGVDSYNFYHDEKIEDLNLLSKYYLNLIDDIMTKSNQTEYHFLGWSLGGKIALEIAAILEQRGIKNITLYLLDTFFCGDVDVKPHEFESYLVSKGTDPDYIQKSLSLLPVAEKLYQCNVSSNLNHTHVLLFKALLSSGYISVDHKIFERDLSLKYNHIDKSLKHETQIKVVNILESHENMLNKSDILVSEMFKFDVLRNSHCSLTI